MLRGRAASELHGVAGLGLGARRALRRSFPRRLLRALDGLRGLEPIGRPAGDLLQLGRRPA